MAFIPTAKIVAFVKKNCIPIFLGYAAYQKYSHMNACDHAYKFVYSGNDIERTQHIKSLEDLIASNEKNKNI